MRLETGDSRLGTWRLETGARESGPESQVPSPPTGGDHQDDDPHTRSTAGFRSVSFIDRRSGSERTSSGADYRPRSPGGPSDTAVRLILRGCRRVSKQTFVADNRPGSNGIAGTDIAAKPRRTATRWRCGNSGTHAINPSLYSKLPYDPVRDFAPVAQARDERHGGGGEPRAAGENARRVHSARAKKQPGKLNVGVAGATGEITGDALWARAPASR